jgi:hypothetical protein
MRVTSPTRAILVWTLLSAAAWAGPATVAAASSAPALVPRPREMRLDGGVVRLTRDWVIVRGPTAEDSLTALVIVDEGERCFGWRWRTSRTRTTGPCIVLATDTARSPVPLYREQGYRLRIDRKLIVISAPSSTGRLYGVQTLRQLFRGARGDELPCLAIRDHPALRWRGVSDDLSRGRVPTGAALDATLEHLAYYKFNLYQPYIESIDDLLDPSGAPGETERFRRADLLALFESGRRHHIAICPIVATISHRPVETEDADPPAVDGAGSRRPVSTGTSGAIEVAWLWWRDRLEAFTAATRGAVCGQRMAPGSPELAQLARGIGELARIAPGPFLHLGGDEWVPAAPDHPGAGASMADYGRAMAELIAPSRGGGALTPMMYADVLEAHPEAGASLPRDVALVEWDYRCVDPALPLVRLAATGFAPLFVSPGLWDWCTFYPADGRAFANIAALTEAARRHGAAGSITASWGDGGGECLRENDWPGFAFAAACSWECVTPTTARFLDDFVRTEFGTPEPGLSVALSRLGWQEFPGFAYATRLMDRPPVVRPASARWRSQMRALADAMREAEESSRAGADRVRFHTEEIAAMRHAIARYAFIAERELLGDSLGRALEASRGGTLPVATRDSAVLRLVALGGEMARLRSEYRLLWLNGNRLGGLAVIDRRLARQQRMSERLAGITRSGQLMIDGSYAGLQAMRGATGGVEDPE